MKSQNSIEKIFLDSLRNFNLDEANLDYSLVERHISVLQNLALISNSGTSIFDIYKREIIFYSSNFGAYLGYQPSDYQDMGQMYFAQKIHPDDAHHLSSNGVIVYQIFNNFTSEEKLQHKLISEYRILNAQNNYVRLVEQYQVLELDAKGNLWLMLNITDISPSQDVQEGSKSQLLNFKTGKIIQTESETKPEIELTKRETEILHLVKEGLLSKEISDKLSISINTVNTHRQRFLKKLGANNSMEAVAFATKYGLLS